MTFHLERARRLELSDAHGMERAVRAYLSIAKMAPIAIERLGEARLLYDGQAASPLSRCVGLGLGETSDAQELPRIEAFYATRGEPARIDVCPYTSPELFEALSERGYRPKSYKQVLVHDLKSVADPGPLEVREVQEHEAEPWARAIATGFEEGKDPAPLALGLMRRLLFQPGLRRFAAFDGARLLGGGALFVDGDLASLFSGAVPPAHRGRGVQRALLEARLRAARDAGATWASMSALPGGTSHRNAERVGFRVEYTKHLMVRAR